MLLVVLAGLTGLTGLTGIRSSTASARGPDGALRLPELLPNPSKETSDGRCLTYEFDPPPGDRFEMSLDARTAPDQNGSWAVLENDGSLSFFTRADAQTG